MNWIKENRKDTCRWEEKIKMKMCERIEKTTTGKRKNRDKVLRRIKQSWLNGGKERRNIYATYINEKKEESN